MLILGFFGVGKTTLSSKRDDVVDLDGMDQSIHTVRKMSEKYPIVLADPFWANPVRFARVPFYVVVPTIDRKEEYLSNFARRYIEGTGGGDEEFIEMINSEWDKWISYMKRLPSIKCVELPKGKWLEDVISSL